MASPNFTIDPDRVQRFIAAGEAAVAAAREFADAERDVRARLSRLKAMRDSEEASAPRRGGWMEQIGSERVFVVEPHRHEPAIVKLEDELARTLQRCAEGAVRRQHDMRLSSRVREFIGERQSGRIVFGG